MTSRLSYDKSCGVLQSQRLIEDGTIPPLPQRPPRHDDEVLGVSFFRTLLDSAKLEHLTLPRTYFGRSEIRASSFQDSDFSESTANWNDFLDVNFNSAHLSRCDFRSCVFQNVNFCGTQLTDADFRHCSFTNCDFTDADLTNTKFTKAATASLKFSASQQQTIAWQANDGEEPEGG
jgi:uncharacterized protein YjbI with pentapeptide repeats